MATGFTKLASSLIHSSIWDEPPDICKVWITLLAMCDRDGMVRSSVGGLVNAARVQHSTVERALTIFESPDPDSKDPRDEGRRLKRVNGGFLLVNYVRYRMDPATERRRERDRLRQKEHRERLAQQEPVQPPETPENPAPELPLSEPKAPVHRFVPPTLEEVKLGCAKVGLPEQEAENFINHYTSVGWKIGNRIMVSWPHALARWRNGWQLRQQPKLRGGSTPNDSKF